MTSQSPVLLLDAGEVEHTMLRAVGGAQTSIAKVPANLISSPKTVDTSAITNPPPVALLQNFAQANGNAGQFLRYEVPLSRWQLSNPPNLRRSNYRTPRISANSISRYKVKPSVQL